ncbi:MAG TPA: rRNA adenine dimethyltransferase family protein [Chloroflexota bacterium]|nr:rRNA adenine dimethyltransferase family protein [Chloroflexota bacterium]
MSRFRSAGPASGAARPIPRAPRRRIALSQNFLTDPALVERVLDRTTVGPEDVVYEIGAGAGAITDRLARRCRHVVAVEKDASLAERLRRRFAARTNVSVFLADALEFPLPLTPYKVVANLPFSVTSAVVARLTRAEQPPGDSFLGVQREAAERFAGSPAETLVSLSLKPRFAPQIVYRFERADFSPRPGVDVVLLRLHKRGPPLLGAAGEALYRDLVAHVFGAWRPTVRRALGALLPSPPPGIDLRVAPGALPFDAWLTLFRHFQCTAPAGARRRVAGAAARVAGPRWHES